MSEINFGKNCFAPLIFNSKYAKIVKNKRTLIGVISIMENTLENNVEIPQEEYTFPNLIPSLECKELLQVLKAKIKPHKIVFWLAFGAFMLFMILTMVLSLTQFSAESSSGHFDNASHYVYDYKADYTGTIICAVLCAISIIVGIVNLALSAKYSKNLNCLTGSIKINTQYSAFINQGYDKKEAYKLTLEWLDRQANIAALNSVATSSAMIAMTNITHINNH